MYNVCIYIYSICTYPCIPSIYRRCLVPVKNCKVPSGTSLGTQAVCWLRSLAAKGAWHRKPKKSVHVVGEGIETSRKSKTDRKVNLHDFIWYLKLGDGFWTIFCGLYMTKAMFGWINGIINREEWSNSGNDMSSTIDNNDIYTYTFNRDLISLSQMGNAQHHPNNNGHLICSSPVDLLEAAAEVPIFIAAEEPTIMACHWEKSIASLW